MCQLELWRNGQDAGGIAGVKNKLVNCGRKRIEIDPEAIRAVPLRQRTTFQDLANALGIKKSTLFNVIEKGISVGTLMTLSSA